MNQIYQMVWKYKLLSIYVNGDADAKCDAKCDADADADAVGSAIALPGLRPGELKIVFQDDG